MKTLEKLTAKINPHEIQWRIQSAKNGKTTVVPYLTNRCVMERFDEQFGALNWKNEFVEWRGKGVKCGLSAWVGDNIQWVTKYDGADETNIESTKGGFSDSMKRAAVQWGLGRDLYEYPMIQIEGETKFLTRSHERELNNIAQRILNGENVGDYVKIGNGQTLPPKAQTAPPKAQKPELKPNTEQWNKAIKFLVDGGVISKIEGAYALTEANRKLLMETALDKA